MIVTPAYAGPLSRAEVNVDRLLFNDAADLEMALRAVKGLPPFMSVRVCAAVDRRFVSGDFRLSQLMLSREEDIRVRWADARTRRGYRSFLDGIGSFARLPVMLAAADKLPPPVWWRVFGERWDVTEGAGAKSAVLRRRLRSASPELLALTMTPKSRRILAKMPERISVWRGCYAINRRGLSWTLDRQLAESFPVTNRYSRAGEQPLLLTGEVRKEHAILFLDRGESEILSARVRVVCSEPFSRNACYEAVLDR